MYIIEKNLNFNHHLMMQTTSTLSRWHIFESRPSSGHTHGHRYWPVLTVKPIKIRHLTGWDYCSCGVQAHGKGLVGKWKASKYGTGIIAALSGVTRQWWWITTTRNAPRVARERRFTDSLSKKQKFTRSFTIGHKMQFRDRKLTD